MVTRQVSGTVLRDAWQGARYVVTNRTLRWLAVSLSAGNVGWGMTIVALPVIVFKLHGNAAVVGGLLALMGAVGIPAALLAGRIRSDGRERRIMAAGVAITGVGILALLIPALAVVALAVVVIGAAEGPINVTVFSLRQRSTHPAWFGRAFAVSMSLNFAGVPIGSALSGPLLGVSVSLTLVLAATLSILSAGLMLAKLPAAPNP